MYQLSASKMGVLRECERCFWDSIKLSIGRPKGIKSSLPTGIDGLLKDYFGSYRGSLPPELDKDINGDKISGVLMEDAVMIRKWQNWASGLRYIDKALDVQIIGALDDCLYHRGVYIPIDFKTKGKEPMDNGAVYYQLQLDIYQLLLESNGYKTSGKSYLVYLYPTETGKNISMRFGWKIFPMECSAKRAKDQIKSAVELLNKKRPAMNINCEYCRYIENKGQYDKERK